MTMMMTLFFGWVAVLFALFGVGVVMERGFEEAALARERAHNGR